MNGILAGTVTPGALFSKEQVCSSTLLENPESDCDLGAPGTPCNAISFGFGFTAVGAHVASEASGTPAYCE